MGFLMKIIDFILGLFGMKKEPEAHKELSSGEREEIKAKAVQGLEDVEGAENISVHGSGAGSKVIKSTPGADLIEDDGEQQWCDRVDTDVPRASWKDVWGPLAKVPEADRLVEFIYHQFEFDHARSGDPLAAEQKLLAFGYSSVGEFYYVHATILKHFGTPSGPNVGDGVFQSQEYQSAGLKAAAKQRAAKQAEVIAANPELLSPVEGVSVEVYAQIQARVAQQISQPDLMKLLAEHKLDFAAWGRASTVWNDRMSKDHTGTITTLYGQAFMNSGQGQFGGAAQAGAATGWDGSAAGGKEPMPFEKCCEIQGAMAAWSKSGQDVNALLKSKFNMLAADFSAAHTWWLTQLMADLPRFNDYTAKTEAYEKKYAGSTGASDSDIQF